MVYEKINTKCKTCLSSYFYNRYLYLAQKPLEYVLRYSNFPSMLNENWAGPGIIKPISYINVDTM